MPAVFQTVFSGTGVLVKGTGYDVTQKSVFCGFAPFPAYPEEELL